MTSSNHVVLFPMEDHNAGHFTSPERWLTAYSHESLQTLCRSRGIPFRDGISKQALMRLLAAELFRSTLIRNHLAALEEPERVWITRFAQHGGALSSEQVSGFQTDDQSAISLRKLTTRGLLLPGPFDGSVPTGRFDVTDPDGPLWCPEPVRLLAADQSPASLIRPFRGEAYNVKVGDRRLLEHDLMAMADQLGQAPVRRLKSGFPGKRFLARVSESLSEPINTSRIDRMETAGYLLFVYEIMSQLGMLRTRNDRISTSQQVEAFFRNSPATRVHALLDAWRDATWYNELYHVSELMLEHESPDYEHGDGKTNDLPTPEDLISGRDYLLDLAASMPANTWVSLQSLMYAAYVHEDCFLIKPPRNHFYAHAPLYHGIWVSNETDVRGVWSNGLERAGNWSIVEGGFIRVVFTESLHRLGLIDVAESDDGETLVRLNAVGAWLLAGGEEPELALPRGKALVVQPNFDIIVFPEGRDVSLLWLLMQSTEVISRDVALTLRITADSIFRAAQRGISAESVLELLQENARAPIPANVAQAMSDWDQRYQQATISVSVDLVEATSADEFDRFIDDANAEQTLVRRLSDTIGIVTGPFAKLPPMTVLDYRKTLPPSIHVDTDLEITIEPARENWQLRPRLTSIAERMGPNRYRITRESVDAAGVNDDLYRDILDLLRTSALEEIPARALFKLQCLFDTVGSASLGDVTVMQVTQEHVLTRMLEIDDFRELFLQRLGPTTVIVRPERIDELNNLLDDFAIPEHDPVFTKEALPPRRANGVDDSTRAHQPVERPRLETYSSRKSRELLEEAIRQNRRARIFYRPQTDSRIQERTVDPISVERRHGIAFLTAYCHLRGEVQVFRVPSIERIELLDAPPSAR